ncbi:MAG: toll/interleukin-1 receptor domain-containing protein [Bacteroides sp.]|nr:toll/interleukin-1 receptor domain-containing protein [Bacteroides sp.]MCM1549649.1 toll/interleukin-1 receptor domain-containing protein [Clostridium sp.]
MMINLIMVYADNTWDQSPAFINQERCLTEYILPEYKEKYSDFSMESIEFLKQLPCIFAYERQKKKDAVIGCIKNIEVQQTNVRIDYEIGGESIAFDNFIQLSGFLDMGTWEWNRTHWTIKKTNIDDLKPYFKNKCINRPKVFVSYSWNPPSNQQNVFELIKRLEQDEINVIYDRKDLYPGQDMNYFMESVLVSDEIDAVIIICNRDYAEKANNRSGGVGYESELILTEIKSKPLQRKYIPVVIDYNENGELPPPNFLKSRYCIDLSKDTGYDDLLNAIRELKEK